MGIREPEEVSNRMRHLTICVLLFIDLERTKFMFRLDLNWGDAFFSDNKVRKTNLNFNALKILELKLLAFKSKCKVQLTLE